MELGCAILVGVVKLVVQRIAPLPVALAAAAAGAAALAAAVATAAAAAAAAAVKPTEPKNRKFAEPNRLTEYNPAYEGIKKERISSVRTKQKAGGLP